MAIHHMSKDDPESFLIVAKNIENLINDGLLPTIKTLKECGESMLLDKKKGAKTYYGAIDVDQKTLQLTALFLASASELLERRGNLEGAKNFRTSAEFVIDVLGVFNKEIEEQEKDKPSS